MLTFSRVNVLTELRMSDTVHHYAQYVKLRPSLHDVQLTRQSSSLVTCYVRVR